MVAWRDGIDITVEMAFGDAPKAASPTWTDVSAYVRRPIIINRGTTSELSGISPGLLSLRLDNRDRRFDPDYAAGPYYGDLVPMVKVRVQATYDATTVSLFTGFITGWTQQWILGGDGTVEVSAVDGSRFVQSAQLAGSAYAAAVLGTTWLAYYWPLQTATGLIDLGPTPKTALISTGAGVVAPSLETETLPIGEASALTTTAESGFSASGLSSDEPRSVEAWLFGTGAGSTIIAATTDCWIQLEWNGGVVTATFSNGSEGDYAEAEASFDTNGSHVVACADLSSLYLYVDGRPAATATLGSGAVSGPAPNAMVTSITSTGTAISHLAYYSDDLSAATVTAHYIAGVTAYGHPYGERSGERIDRALDEIDWPAGQRSIDTGDTVQGPYLPGSQVFLDYARQVTDSEQGVIFFDVDGNIAFRGRNSLWTASRTAPLFADDSGGLPLLDENGDPLLDENSDPLLDETVAVRYFNLRPAGNHVDTIRNIATTSYSTVGAITQRDQTSIDAYGESRQFTDCPTIDDANTASQLSAYIVRERKDPKVFVEQIDCHMRLTAGGINQFATLAGLELADIALVRHTPNGVTPSVTRTVMVAGITHTIDNAQWDVSLFCGSAPAQYDAVPYLTLGDPVYGRIGATADNRVPF